MWLRSLFLRIRLKYALRSLSSARGRTRTREWLETLERPLLTDDYLTLMRQLRGELSTGARVWRLVLHWTAKPSSSPPHPAVGFFRHYIVVAESKQQALALAVAVEPEGDWAQMRVQEAEDCGPRHPDLIGVFEASGPVWYGAQ